MDIINFIFKRKSVDFDKLTAYGFVKEIDKYSYSTVLSGSGFEMTVTITEQGEIGAVIIDPAFNEPYTLHLADGAVGSFVGSVKEEYERILTDIADKCFIPDVFKSNQAKEIIAFVKDKYNDEFEYLWEKFPDNAVVRRKDNKKWYAALLTVSKRKLGIDSDEIAEVIDLRIKPENLEELIDGVNYFPGYHMNKKHWYTIILDSTVPIEEICERLAESYRLAKLK
ncbi:MAG: MmcQ/YjbR family DNA-binding protein [Clostridium sp.]|nr:MmcQ/YjbR family DNA-binding protein [Clostridium sp.]